jgi:hypothetical protein
MVHLGDLADLHALENRESSAKKSRRKFSLFFADTCEWSGAFVPCDARRLQFRFLRAIDDTVPIRL